MVDRYVVIGSKGRFHVPLPDRVTVCKASDLKTCDDLQGRIFFVSCVRASTDALLKARLGAPKVQRFDRLLTMETPRAGSVPAALGVFGQVIGIGDYRWLPVEELIAVVTGKDAVQPFYWRRLLIRRAGTLALMRGDFQTVIVPFSMFEETADGAKPDFGDLSFTD